MSYYDHITAITFKLGAWAEDPVPKKYELERLQAEVRIMSHPTKKPSIFRRCLRVIRTRESSEQCHCFEPPKS